MILHLIDCSQATCYDTSSSIHASPKFLVVAGRRSDPVQGRRGVVYTNDHSCCVCYASSASELQRKRDDALSSMLARRRLRPPISGACSWPRELAGSAGAA